MNPTDQALSIRQHFPVLESQVRGKSLVYLDNGATTHKPTVVVDRMHQFAQEENATVHRGIYYMSQEATRKCDLVRKKVQGLLSARSENEIIFVKGTTEAINLVSHCMARSLLKKGQDILISEMEHHANIVPWQQVCEHYELNLKIVPFDDSGLLDMSAYKDLLSENTGFVSMVHISNTLGTINPIKEIIDLAHKYGAYTLIDGAQAIAHQPINVTELDCDFYCFSAHKMFGPTGIGILYGKEALLEQMPPYQFGGDMIDVVNLDHTTFAGLPHKFEAGTPAVTQIIGLGAAVDYLLDIGWSVIHQIETQLTEELGHILDSIDGVQRIGTVQPRGGLFSFLVDGCHAYDVGTLLDQQGICVRVGHHCTQPVMQHYGIEASIRASVAAYNTAQDLEAFRLGLLKAKTMLS